ncbi:MAG: hypothetical protein A2Z04_07305 [Chloroflexi bacterium RBG_16_57_9]|nr:MAG: hypothetical protein A2Z04_07305 [Chloroflexi bacterium RBG_16_57_9]
MKARLKKPLIAILAILVLLGLGAAVFVLMPIQGGKPMQISINFGGEATETPTEPVSEHSATPKTTQKVTSRRPTPVPEPPAEGILLPLGTKVINLADPGGYRYLKVGIVIEFEPEDPKALSSLKGEARIKKEEEIVKELKSRSAVYEDIIMTLFSSKTFEEVFTVQGKEHVKEQIREQINTHLGSEEVLGVYFTDFVIQ